MLELQVVAFAWFVAVVVIVLVVIVLVVVVLVVVVLVVVVLVVVMSLLWLWLRSWQTSCSRHHVVRQSRLSKSVHMMPKIGLTVVKLKLSRAQGNKAHQEKNFLLILPYC